MSVSTTLFRQTDTRPAVSDATDTLTYGQLREGVERCGQALATRRFPRGAASALLFASAATYPVGYYGCRQTGLVPVSISSHRRHVDVVEILRALPVQVILCDVGHRDMVAGILQRLDYRPLAATLDTQGALHVLQEAENMAPAPWPDVPDVESLVYSAGNTGNPRGVFQTTQTTQWARRLWRASLSFTADDRVMVILPACQSTAQSLVLHTLLYEGAAVQYSNASDADTFLRQFKAFAPTIICGTPAGLRTLCDAVEGGDCAPTALRLGISATGPVTEALVSRFASIIKRPLLNCYGTVECSGITSVVPVLEDTRIATLGDFCDDVRLEVVREDGTHISMDEVGEIRIAGPHMSLLTLPGLAPAASPRDDGWFYTGDLATIAENGAILLLTRDADVIHKGGYAVYPGEIESVVAAHPAVQEVALVGVSDDWCIEEVKGFVVLKPGQTMTESDLVAYCSQHLPVYKCPRHVQFVARLPRNYLGQVLRKDLRKLTQPAASQHRHG